MGVHLIDKQAGETPLSALGRLRLLYPELAEKPLTYAGRLDPLATGIIIVLSGGSIEHKQDFLNLEKEYECELLLGVSTDTGDILGLVTDSKEMEEISEDRIRQAVSQFVGTHIQRYPVFSSKAVDGKPLWLHAREGSGVATPDHEVIIHSIEFLGMRSTRTNELLADITSRIEGVVGDFRQAEITAKWQQLLGTHHANHQLVRIRAVVSSGTYMRVLAEDIGKALGVPALAYTIHRTRVGNYVL